MDSTLVLVGRCMGWCMVKGVWLSCILQSASGRLLSKRKAFLVPGCRTWTLKYLATQKVTHIVLPPNMDSSSFARHHTWQAGRSQMGAKTDMTLFLASTIHFCTNLILLYYFSQ